MSTVVDSRVVEMKFDNKQFEDNVKSTLSTLDKLKNKLNFEGAEKGFGKINAAAKNVNLSSIGTALDSLNAKFSSMGVVGATALANLTNTAVNAGKRMTTALTIAPIKSGFQEYETQINAIQTILANTKSKGSTLDDVNKALAELNKYADLTIYNFTQMTKNIGTFTAAGVDLKTSVSSIKGIANLAAVSGSTSQQASTAMYQLSQALAAGKVQLQDWNSVVNAGMGGEIFQKALMRTADHLGKGATNIVKKYGSFRESLTKEGWLTTEVLTETLSQISGAYDEADLVKQGYSKKQAKEIADLAKTAVSAATEVKTFTQLWDTLQEAAQSGWTKTWELIIGDFDQAKKLLTGISDFMGDIIQKGADRRNNILEGALGSDDTKWDKFYKQLKNAGISTDDFKKKLEETAKESGVNIDKVLKKEKTLAKAFLNGKLSTDLITDTLKKFSEESGKSGKSTEKMADKLEYFQKVVDKVWRGDYKNTPDRIKLLTKAGYDYNQVQKLVNLTVDQHRLTLEDLSKAQLKSIGYTDDEIKKIKELAKQAETSGSSLNELIESMSKKSGRELMLESLNNTIGSLIRGFQAIREAWWATFTDQGASSGLYTILETVHSFSELVKLTDEDIANLKDTFQGLFSIVHIFTTIAGSGLSRAFMLLRDILGLADIDILSVTGSIGRTITAFHDWIFENNMLTKTLKKVLDVLAELKNAVVDWVNSKFPNLRKVGEDAIEGLKEGLESKASEIPNILIDIGNSLLEAIKKVLDIHSPSRKLYEIGVNAMEGLYNGLIAFKDKITNFFKDLGQSIINFVNDIDWAKVYAGLISAGVLYMGKKTYDLVENITNTFGAPMKGLGKVLSSAGALIDTCTKNINNNLKATAKVLRSFAFSVRAKALVEIAKAIAILVGCIVVLSRIDVTALVKAEVALVVTAGVLVGIAYAIDKMSNAALSIDRSGLKISGLGTVLLSIAAAIALLGVTVKMVGNMDPEASNRGITALIAMLGALASFIAVMKWVLKTANEKDINAIGRVLQKIGVALLLMSITLKMLGNMNADTLDQGFLAITGLSIIIMALMAFTRIAGRNIDALGGTLIKISIAMFTLTQVIKRLGEMDVVAIAKGELAILGFVGILALLAAITRKSGFVYGDLGGVLMKAASAIAIMAFTIKIFADMPIENIVKGQVAIAAFGLIILELTAISRLAGREAPKIAGTLLAMSLAIGILAGIAVLLSFVNPVSMAPGIFAIFVLSKIMSGMIKATANAKDCKGNLIVMSVAIGIMAAAVVALSFIEPSKLFGAVGALGVLMLIFTGMTKAAGAASNAMGSLIVLTVVIGVLTGAIAIIAQLPIQDALGAVASLSVLMLALSGAMLLIGKAGQIAPSALIGVGVMLAVMAGLAGVLYLMENLSAKSTVVNAAALSAMLLSISGACLILSKVGIVAPGAAIGAAKLIGVLTLTAGVLVAIAGLVDLIPDAEKFLDGGIRVLEKIGYGLGNFFGSIVGGFGAGVTSTLPEMGADIATFIKNIQPFIKSVSKIKGDSLSGAKDLIEIIGTLSGAGLDDSISNFISGSDESSLEKFSTELNTFADGIISFSKKISAKGAIDNDAIDNVVQAGKLLTAFKRSLPSDPGAFYGLFTTNKDLGSFGTQVQQFGEGMSAMSKAVTGENKIDPQAVENVVKMGELFAALKASLPPDPGFFLGLFSTNQDLSNFADDAKEFATAMVELSDSLTGDDGGSIINTGAVQAAADAGLFLSALKKDLPEDPGEVLGRFTTSKDLGKFGDQAKKFGEGMRDASNALVDESGKSVINKNAIQAASDAGKILSAFKKDLPEDPGIVLGWFTTNQDLGDFGRQAKLFCEAIGQASKALVDENGKSIVATDAIQAATDAGLLLSALKKDLPDDPGAIFGLFTTSKDLGGFADDIKKFGDNIAEISKALTGEDGLSIVNTDAIGAATAAGQMLSNLQKSLPESHLFDGKTDLYSFGIKIGQFGTQLASYSDTVKNLDTGKVSASIYQAQRLANLARSTDDLDTSGLEKFKELKKLGEYIADYAAEIENVNVDELSKCMNALKDSVSAISNMSGIKTDGVGLFKKAMDELKTVSLDGVLTAFENSASRLQGAGFNLIESIGKGVKSGQSSLKATLTATIGGAVIAVQSKSVPMDKIGRSLASGLGKGILANAKEVTKAVTNLITDMGSLAKSQNTAFNTTGKEIIREFTSGISSAKNKPRAAISDLSKDSVKSARGYYSEFNSAGSYLAMGFAKGIESSTWYANLKSRAMARAAAKAAKEELDEHSPSKVGYEIGDFFGIAFVNGISDNEKKAYAESAKMASSAKKGLGNAMNQLTTMLLDDIDTQPTIRPVLDLSDIQSNARAINGLLNNRASIGVSANVDSIRRTMNQNGTNHGNQEVVSAINKLRKDLANVGNTTYRIDGITYDDGSNISDAVKTLTRAVKVERRI